MFFTRHGRPWSNPTTNGLNTCFRHQSLRRFDCYYPVMFSFPMRFYLRVQDLSWRPHLSKIVACTIWQHLILDQVMIYLNAILFQWGTFGIWPWRVKGRVRIRKSKSGEKWNEQLVNDAYGVLLYRCCTSKLCSCNGQILHHGCALKRERWASWAFLPKLMHFKDFKWIFYYQCTPALVILFQHINKYGNLSC